MKMTVKNLVRSKTSKIYQSIICIALIICTVYVLIDLNLIIIHYNVDRFGHPKHSISLYDYYTSGGIIEGLNADRPYFTLNGRNITIFSGSWSYFRVPKAYWRDRLRRFRSGGLNAIETYIPWNLHEIQPGIFDFGNGPSDFTDFLDLEYLLKVLVEEDLFLIVRPGPYICAEWEFGGFPSWLVNEPNITLRSSDDAYMHHVRRYFNELMPRLAQNQFRNGGPIIAIQVENEYASRPNPDQEYLEQLVALIRGNGIQELLVTSDAAGYKVKGSIPEALKMVNFGGSPKDSFDTLLQFQPNRPVMAMEFYSGWFDHWGEKHHITNSQMISQWIEEILQYPGSFSVYMYLGGTQYGFLNGANFDSSSRLQPSTTSYDYDAPLSEAGDYRPKYHAIANLLKRYNPIKTRLPEPPKENFKKIYPSINITHQLPLHKILKQVPRFKYKHPINMEALPINNFTGQQYGYIVYRKVGVDIKPNSVLQINGRVCDSVMVLVNNILVSKPLETNEELNGFGYWRIQNGTLNLGPSINERNAILDLVVENWGRVNYGNMNEANTKKGLWQGDVLLNGKVVRNWLIYPLEFRKDWINNLKHWERFDPDHTKQVVTGPALYKTEMNVEVPYDTFLDLQQWNSGFVTLNGFNLGRYCVLGPQRFLYIPAPLFNRKNKLVLFEKFSPNWRVEFSDQQIYSTIDYSGKSGWEIKQKFVDVVKSK